MSCAWYRKLAYEDVNASNNTSATLIDDGLKVTSLKHPKFFEKAINKIGLICEIKNITWSQTEDGVRWNFMLVLPKQKIDLEKYKIWASELV